MKHQNKTHKDDTPLAGLCFALAVTLALIGLYTLATHSQHLVVPFVGVALISVVTGLQQLNKYRIKPDRFKARLRNLAIGVAVATVGAVVLANLL